MIEGACFAQTDGRRDERGREREEASVLGILFLYSHDDGTGLGFIAVAIEL